MSNDKNRNNIDAEESDSNALLTENAVKPEKKERKKAPVGAEGHRKRMFDDLEKNGAGGISDRHLLEMLLPPSDAPKTEKILHMAGLISSLLVFAAAAMLYALSGASPAVAVLGIMAVSTIAWGR